jgi:hypothetical protein
VRQPNEPGAVRLNFEELVLLTPDEAHEHDAPGWGFTRSASRSERKRTHRKERKRPARSIARARRDECRPREHAPVRRPRAYLGKPGADAAEMLAALLGEHRVP